MTPAHEDIAARLQQGLRIDRIADLVGVDRRTVTHYAHQLGYRITAQGTAQPIGAAPMTLTPQPSSVATANGPRPRMPLSTLAAALVELRHHVDKKVARRATVAHDKVAGLLAAVHEYDSKAEARAEVERLEQQLREAKARLGRGNPKPTKTVAPEGLDYKAVRAWCAANGVQCAATGRVPKAAVDAYLAAQAAA
jgi:hypothetical protein